MDSTRFFYPRNLLIITIACFLVIISALILIGYDKYVKGIYSIRFFFFSPLIAFLIVALPFFLSLRSIRIISMKEFIYKSPFWERHYTIDSVYEVWIDSILMYGVKDYLRIVLTDGKTIGVVGPLWNDYDQIKQFFVSNCNGKVRKAEGSWQELQ